MIQMHFVIIVKEQDTCKLCVKIFMDIHLVMKERREVLLVLLTMVKGEEDQVMIGDLIHLLIMQLVTLIILILIELRIQEIKVMVEVIDNLILLIITKD